MIAQAAHIVADAADLPLAGGAPPAGKGLDVRGNLPAWGKPIVAKLDEHRQLAPEDLALELASFCPARFREYIRCKSPSSRATCSPDLVRVCAPVAVDHHRTAPSKPKRTPQRSMSQPMGNSPVIMPNWKAATIRPYCALDKCSDARISGASTETVWRSMKLMMVISRSSQSTNHRRFTPLLDGAEFIAHEILRCGGAALLRLRRGER